MRDIAELRKNLCAELSLTGEQLDRWVLARGLEQLQREINTRKQNNPARYARWRTSLVLMELADE